MDMCTGYKQVTVFCVSAGLQSNNSLRIDAEDTSETAYEIGLSPSAVLLLMRGNNTPGIGLELGVNGITCTDN